MTIEELKKAIADLPDNMQVVVSDGKGYLVDATDVYTTFTTDYEMNMDAHVAVIHPKFVM